MKRRWIKPAAAAVAAATMRWNRATERAVARLGGGRATSAPGAVSPTTFAREQLAGLPAPVVRYFEFALTPGQPLIRRARVEHAGDFQMRPGAWSPFTSVDEVSVRPPGFVWDATIRAAPLVAVRVRDGYLEGEGAMHAAAGALVPLVDQRGTPEIAAASLQRYLAEATWFPTALLPSEGVVWAPIDESTARATLTDRGLSVWVDFHFGTRGEIVRASTLRYRDVKGTPVLTPWVGQSREYERVHGMMVPTAGEVAWLLPGEELTYWRGRITSVKYELAQ